MHCSASGGSNSGSCGRTRKSPLEDHHLRGHHIVPPEWVTEIEVSYKENRAGELVKVVFDFGGNEGCAGR